MQPGHYVAIFGGAVAGSEAAEKLASRGVHTVVFEQNQLPYGKIESGLPKWHVKLRDSQEVKIDAKLKHPLVRFVPRVRLGVDIGLEDIINDWGFSAVLLATGAWRDRPLPIQGVDAFINKGLYYQNPFVAWFNQNHDPDYRGQMYEIPDDIIVIGGGLASFDVVKIVMIESVRNALLTRGIETDVLTLEKKGVASILAENSLTMTGLGLKGCTLYYRRTITDMPLTSLPQNPSPKDLETAYRVRMKIFDNIHKKFLFNIAECHMPVDKLVENDRLVGIVFQQTEIRAGRMIPVPEKFIKKRSPLVISAIGSLPEPLDELQMENHVYKIEDAGSGKLAGYDNVFALGNAVTGRGNIKESQVHGRMVTEKVMDEFLAWQPEDYAEIFSRAEVNADEKVEAIGQHLAGRPLLSAAKIASINEKTTRYQQKVGYNGNYDTWINKHLPVRLEELLPVS